MSARASHTTVFGAFILSATWVIVALGLAAVWSSSVGNAEATPEPSVVHHSWRTLVSASGVDPCTNEAVTVEVGLVLDITKHAETGRTDVDIYLADLAAETLPGSVFPLSRSFTPYVTPIKGVSQIHPLRTALSPRYAALDLLVELRGEASEAGDAAFSVADVRIDDRRSTCSRSPVGPPTQPTTHDRPAVVPWRPLA